MLPDGVAFVQVDECAPRARAGGRAILSAPAGDDRRGHRHQRQDLGRGLHPADLGGARASRPRASAPSAWSRRKREVYGSLTTPDPVELHRTLDRTGRARASRISRWRRPRTGSTSTGSTACASRPAASPICRATISTIIRPSKPISRPSCGCSSASGRDGGAAVIDVDHEHADARGRGGEAARPASCSRSGATGDGIRLVDVAIDGFAQTLRARARRQDAIACSCRWSAPSRSRTRWSRPGLRSRPAASRDAVFARARSARRAPRAGSNWSAQRNGAPIFVDYAHKPDALAKALEALRPYVKRKLVVVFGAGGDRDTGKRPLMGAIAAREGRPRHRHRRQSAQRRAGRDPRRDPRRGARRDRDRRPRRGDPHARSPRLQPGDVLLIAGKGHESGQIVGDRVLPFSDHEAVAAALRRRSHERAALDRRRDGRRDAARARRARCRASVPGLSIDTPHASSRARRSSPSRATTATAMTSSTPR